MRPDQRSFALLDNDGKHIGRFISTGPNPAAKKMCSKSTGKSGKVTFVETTKGKGGKMYTYNCKRHMLTTAEKKKLKDSGMSWIPQSKMEVKQVKSPSKTKRKSSPKKSPSKTKRKSSPKKSPSKTKRKSSPKKSPSKTKRN